MIQNDTVWPLLFSKSIGLQGIRIKLNRWFKKNQPGIQEIPG